MDAKGAHFMELPHYMGKNHSNHYDSTCDHTLPNHKLYIVSLSEHEYSSDVGEGYKCLTGITSLIHIWS